MRLAIVCAAINPRVMQKSAVVRSMRSKSIGRFMSEAVNKPLADSNDDHGSDGELARQIDLYIDELTRAGSSPHTVAAYTSDLGQFLHFLTPPELEAPAPQAIDLLLLREWLVALYREKLKCRVGWQETGGSPWLVPLHAARRCRHGERRAAGAYPKGAAEAPGCDVRRAGEFAARWRGVRQARAAFSARDRAIFELLYGCGLRVSELAGLDLDDLDRAERWLRVRGKGRKERQTPVPGQASGALERYLAERPVIADERAVFLNRCAAAG